MRSHVYLADVCGKSVDAPETEQLVVADDINELLDTERCDLEKAEKYDGTRRRDI